MKLSPETRKMFINNMDGELDSDTVHLCSDILDALTNEKGQALNHLDIRVISILANAIRAYHEGTVNHD